MDSFHVPAALERCQRILVAGAGGGFDVYTGIPIYAHLRSLGKESFSGKSRFHPAVQHQREAAHVRSRRTERIPY